MISHLNSVNNFSDLLELKYGPRGQPAREEFERKAQYFILAELLKSARKQAHLTQTQLADKVGTDKSYISRLENGQLDLPLSMLFRIVEQGLGRKLYLEVL